MGGIYRRIIVSSLAALALACLSGGAAHAQALNKTIDVGIGVNGTYWRVTSARVFIKAGKIAFTIEAFIDKPAWQGGKLGIAERSYTMDIPAGAATMTWAQLVDAMRDFAKTQPEFSGATNAT